MVTEQEVEAIGRALVDPAQPLHARFRALFTLRGLGGPSAIAWISRAFDDDSALLKHELAYCLGQMQDARAIPVLVGVLRDPRQEPMVRHEAGEALGAIGDPAVLEILQQYASDPVVEVAETCQLAVRRLEWLQQRGGEPAPVGPYLSVDPAPPAEEQDVGRLREVLLDEARPLFDRYRAMFALRNAGGEEAALALAEGLRCGSALFRHEVGYVLGQLRPPDAKGVGFHTRQFCLRMPAGRPTVQSSPDTNHRGQRDPTVQGSGHRLIPRPLGGRGEDESSVPPALPRPEAVQPPAPTVPARGNLLVSQPAGHISVSVLCVSPRGPGPRRWASLSPPQRHLPPPAPLLTSSLVHCRGWNPVYTR
ncbi:PREDICTED: deoxyhypusine hydroxylase [Ceratotherium simum simum]|uniref:Deoxyhypusine hydroxylase n=1 Tax=Ceratotherium simum simum TaxID=73337 RepID=A0ABM0I6J9_CERSS|nr:PREDICTED: deoxyhypusine hydroxylase [Ceratotherium simum simum]